MQDLVQKYLENVLGLAASKLGACARARALPYYLQEAFSFLQFELAGQDVTLATPKASSKAFLKDIRVQLQSAASLLGAPVVFCPTSLASYERRDLIEQKVPFIVPGNQMYLPDLGIDLRETFRHATQKKAKLLSPATQALLLWHLLNDPAKDHWHPGDAGVALGYTPMTVSRAVRELQAFGLTELVTVGRSKWLHMPRTKAETWAQAKPYLRSPVKRVVWSRESIPRRRSDIRRAGLSALAHLTMLAEPPTPCWAMTLSQWNEALEAGVKELPQPLPGAREWQVWSYSPAMAANAKTVDLLSLWLSLKDEPDERVQMALDELQDAFVW